MSETFKRDSADVHKGAPRFVSLLLKVRAEGEEENQSNSAGVRVEVRTPRFVAWFLACSKMLKMIEWSKINESNLVGDQMKVPRFVVWPLRIRALVEGVQSEGEDAKCSS